MLPPSLWVPETGHTAGDLPVRPQQAARHDPLMAVRLIYQMLSKLLGWIVLRTRSWVPQLHRAESARIRGLSWENGCWPGDASCH